MTTTVSSTGTTAGDIDNKMIEALSKSEPAILPSAYVTESSCITPFNISIKGVTIEHYSCIVEKRKGPAGALSGDVGYLTASIYFLPEDNSRDLILEIQINQPTVKLYSDLVLDCSLKQTLEATVGTFMRREIVTSAILQEKNKNMIVELRKMVSGETFSMKIGDFTSIKPDNSTNSKQRYTITLTGLVRIVK